MPLSDGSTGPELRPRLRSDPSAQSGREKEHATSVCRSLAQARQLSVSQVLQQHLTNLLHCHC